MRAAAASVRLLVCAHVFSLLLLLLCAFVVRGHFFHTKRKRFVGGRWMSVVSLFRRAANIIDTPKKT